MDFIYSGASLWRHSSGWCQLNAPLETNPFDLEWGLCCVFFLWNVFFLRKIPGHELPCDDDERERVEQWMRDYMRAPGLVFLVFLWLRHTPHWKKKEIGGIESFLFQRDRLFFRFKIARYIYIYIKGFVCVPFFFECIVQLVESNKLHPLRKWCNWICLES